MKLSAAPWDVTACNKGSQLTRCSFTQKHPQQRSETPSGSTTCSEAGTPYSASYGHDALEVLMMALNGHTQTLLDTKVPFACYHHLPMSAVLVTLNACESPGAL